MNIKSLRLESVSKLSLYLNLNNLRLNLTSLVFNTNRTLFLVWYEECGKSIYNPFFFPPLPGDFQATSCCERRDSHLLSSGILVSRVVFMLGWSFQNQFCRELFSSECKTTQSFQCYPFLTGLLFLNIKNTVLIGFKNRGIRFLNYFQKT